MKRCDDCIHDSVCTQTWRMADGCSYYEEQRPHGEWEYVTHYARRFRVCSVCKAEKEDDRATGWNFCQFCGSDNRPKER